MEEAFKSALGRLAGGVTIISTGLQGERRGVTATAVCSLSAQPPSVLVCVNQATGTSSMIREAGVFCVNILAEDQQDLAMVFAGATGLQGDDRFAHGDWADTEAGPPVLRGALANVTCRVADVHDFGTHAIFIGEVTGVDVSNGAPLVYAASRFCSLTPE